MTQLLGSYDYYEDKINDFCVTLMCDYQNNLIAYANRSSKLATLQALDEPVFIKFAKDDPGFWFSEFPENLLAKDGYKISFSQATKYFPYLNDRSFWIDEKWTGYNGVEFTELFNIIINYKWI